MNNYFIQFEEGDSNIPDMLSSLQRIGDVHQLLGNLYMLSAESKHSTVTLRDTLLESSEESRVFIMEVPANLNAAWHLTMENSNWLKSRL